MAKKKKLIMSYLFSFIFLFGFLSANCEGAPKAHTHAHKHTFHPQKMFVFGDSYVDTGNTDKSLSNSWKVPYGISFPGKPSGRFSNGRVLTDFIARFYGLESPIPYMLKTSRRDIARFGMNFAFGGTGVFDTYFPGPNMTLQIDFFKALLKSRVYRKRTIVDTSLALVALSGNDYGTYIVGGGLLKNIKGFIRQVVKQLRINLKRINHLGVKKVMVMSLPPLGCLPSITVLNSFHQCNITVNTAAKFHNTLLRQAIANLNNETASTNGGFHAFTILDLYSSSKTLLRRDKFVGINPLKPCCMGINGSSCGSVLNNTGEKMYTVCEKPESSFFWDAVHPSQTGWRDVYLNVGFF